MSIPDDPKLAPLTLVTSILKTVDPLPPARLIAPWWRRWWSRVVQVDLLRPRTMERRISVPERAPNVTVVINWEGIAEFLGYRADQIAEVKALELPPYPPIRCPVPDCGATSDKPCNH